MIRNLFHFLGSIRFAVVLLIMTALYVIAGTFIESITSSHLYAAKLTYHHPLFFILIAGFFINILFSALRRWPFRKKHVPFLITHLGLLMVISGVVLKAIYGLQGSMGLAEGTGINEVFTLNTYEIALEAKNEQWKYPLKEGLFGGYATSLAPLKENSSVKLSLLQFFAHHEKEWLSWIKEGDLHINGIQPISLSKEEIYLRIFEDDPVPWKVTFQEADIADELVDQWKFIKEQPEILIVKDKTNSITVATENHRQKYPSNELQSVVVYDKGFRGYAQEFVVNKEGREKPIETMLQAKFIPKSPLQKLEDNRPFIILHAEEDNNKENILLGYDPYGEGLKWPILKGKYLARFQPRFYSLPYHVRLRGARKIEYPSSGQPFSYECDLIIKDLRNGQSEEVTLSMNHIHETKDGYRFYLANVVPSDGSTSGSVQLAVNYAPGKYLLTYPGACLVAIGILLLYRSNFKNRFSTKRKPP